MEIKNDRSDEHAVDIASDRHESASSQANSVAHDHQHTSLMVAACQSTGNVAAATTTSTTVGQTSSSKSNKQQGPGPSQDDDQQQELGDDDGNKHGQNGNEKAKKSTWTKASEVCLNIALVFLALPIIVVSLIPWSLVFVFTFIVIPGIIIFLVLAYMITSIHQFCRCDDYADLDDEYDTDLGTYRYELVVWMIKLTCILVCEMLASLALFRIGPFALRRLTLVDVHVWKWFLIGIIVLVYLGFWLMTHIVVHKAREKSQIPSVFFRVHVLPILKGLLGAAVCGFYFLLVELLILKLVPPLKRPKILGFHAYKWTHALVYVFIGLNVSRIISASIVAILQKKYEHDGKFDYNSKDEKAASSSRPTDPSDDVLNFMRRGCRFIMGLLFTRFDTKMIYVVTGLRRSINFVLITIWLLVTWISHFVHHVKPSHDTCWIPRVGTGTLISLLICAILWLVKNCIMLWWKYRSIYQVFSDEVLEAGIKLYLLGMICGSHLDVLNVKKKKNADQDNRERRVVAKARKTLVHNPQEKAAADDKTTSSYQPGIYAIMRMVRYFLLAEDTFKKDINATSIEKLRSQAHPGYDQNACSTPLTRSNIEAAYGTKLFDNDDFDNDDFVLLSSQRIKEDDQNSEKQLVNLQDFERWMERSHKTCYDIVCKLASAQKLALYLNRVMIAVIIIITIAIWLTLITNSTKTVTVLGGPILAVSFIFGETCSTVFKGIIFSYVIHPFNIGDICIIKSTLYEVKHIDFWTTTFLKVETKEEVSYPNSALFSDPIIKKRINKKGGLGGYHDSIEFILESNTNMQNLSELKKKIDDYFSKEQFTNFQKPQFEMKSGAIGDTGKQNVIIHFKHNLKDFSDLSNSECLQKMKRRKEQLKHDIMNSFPELKIDQTG